MDYDLLSGDDESELNYGAFEKRPKSLPEETTGYPLKVTETYGSAGPFLKYPSLPHFAEVPEILDAEDLEVYEKLDGGNSQARVVGGRLLSGCRSKYLTQEKRFRMPWFKKLQDNIMSNLSLYNLPENFVLFGEFLAPHTLDYNENVVDNFFMIDLFDTLEECFVPYQEAAQMLIDMEVKKVNFLPLLAKGSLDKKTIEDLALGRSDYRRGLHERAREGVVIKDYENQRFAKLWGSSLIGIEHTRYHEVLEQEVVRILSGVKDHGQKEMKKSKLLSYVLHEIGRGGKSVNSGDIKKTFRNVYNSKI